MKFKFKFGLLPRVLLAICLGLLLGPILPVWLLRIFQTFNSIFGEYLNFLIPLIIVGLVTPAIADLEKGGGRILVVTLIISYVITLVSGVITYFASAETLPHLITTHGIDTALDTGSSSIAPYFKIDIPPLMNVMDALVISFLIGIGAAYAGSKSVYNFFKDFRLIMGKAITSSLLPLIPIYIFGIFLRLSASDEVSIIMRVFASIVLLMLVLHIIWLLILYFTAGAIVKRNPFKLLLQMLPVYFTAYGTQSSAATIPVTLEHTLKMGVRLEIASFTIPLCATINLSGSMLKLVVIAVAFMIMRDMPFDFGLFMGFICVMGITLIAAPGVPSGVIMAAVGVLSSMLGFSEEDLGIVIAIYVATGGFGTATNVTGDGAIALVVEKIFKKQQLNIAEGGGE